MDPVVFPDTFADLEPEALSALLEAALKESDALAGIDAAELNDDQIDRLTILADGISGIRAENGVRETAAADRVAKIEAARARIAEAQKPADEADESIDEIVDAEVIPDNAAELEAQDALVASAARVPVKRPFRASRVAAQAPAVILSDEEDNRGIGTITAAAGVPDHEMGQALPDFRAVAQAFISRVDKMPKSKGARGSYEAFGVAKFKKKINPAFQLTKGDQQKNTMAVLEAARAYKEDATGSLVAAGGWCAPSTTIYDIPTTRATVTNILSIPEVTFDRGGINFTRGPDFSAIYAASGFLQTEAQAQAGTVKNFIDVQCPGFQEVRLDAIGYGVRASILTDATWPELTQDYIEKVLIAHAHKVNATVINRIVAMSGALINAQEYGGGTVDTLTALEIQAIRLRYKYRLADDARIEGFAPVWLAGALRADLAYQTGLDQKAVTNAMINTYLSVRGIYLQWVYDWQDLTSVVPAEVAKYPDAATVVLYPTGTFVKGTTDVISLDAVYDTASLAVNTFTAAFFEEGLAVFSPEMNGVQVQIALNLHGRSGAADITGATPVPA